MEIRRDKYLRLLVEGRGNGMVKIITGLRRCGKSYLLFKIFYNYLKNHGVDDKHIIKIDLEDRRNKLLRNPDALLEYIDSKIPTDGNCFILLDEVQHVPEFEDVLNSYLKTPNVDIYVTGSNSKFLSSDIATEFRGRGDQIHVYPLSFSEYMGATTLTLDDAWREYYTYGGLPHILSLNSHEKKQQYLKDLSETVYIKDIVDRYRLRNVTELRDLMTILASAIGAPTNPHKLTNTFKTLEKSNISDKTIQLYLSYIIDSFIAKKALRYDIKGKKYINNLSKYYFTDMGIRNSLLNYRQLEESHIMENIIYNELLYRGLSVDVGDVEAWEQNSQGQKVRKHYEVDFVVNSGSQRVYIQSALEMDDIAKQQQEKGSYKRIPDSFKKIIIIRRNIEPYYDEDGVRIIGLMDFLLGKEALL